MLQEKLIRYNLVIQINGKFNLN